MRKCNPLIPAYFQCKNNSRQWSFPMLTLRWDFEMSDVINETCHYLEVLRWVLCEWELESCKCKHPHVKLKDILCKIVYLLDSLCIWGTLVIYYFMVYLGFSEIDTWQSISISLSMPASIFIHFEYWVAYFKNIFNQLLYVNVTL